MVTFKGNMLTVSNPARVSPKLKIAIKKIWYVQTFWNLFFNWSVYHLNSVLLLSVAKLISLSSRFVNHYCCTAWTVEWLTCCVQRFYFYQKRMFYKLYSAWVQNSSVITKLYVYRNPVGVQICTCFHFPLSV